MTKSKGSILLIGFILSVFSFFPILNVKALTISYPTWEIHTNQDETFSDAEFYFQIGNDGLGNITVTPTFEVMFLEKWEEYYSVTFDKGNVTLSIGESVRYYPTIYNNVPLGYTYQLHFTFEGRSESTGNVITSGVGASVDHHVKAKDEGFRLIINSIDQADRQVNSFIRLYYGGDAEKGQGWNIIKSMNTTFYENILIKGWYRILAIEPTINDQRDEIFYLSEDMNINLIFELLAFTSMQIFIPRTSTGLVNISYTLSNNYELLSNVYIHFYVIVQSGSLIFNSTSIKPSMDKGIYQETLIINTQWFSDTYFFIGEVYVNGRLFLQQNDTQALYFPDNPYQYGNQPQNLDFFIIGLILIIIGLFGLAFFRHELMEKYRIYKRQK